MSGENKETIIPQLDPSILEDILTQLQRPGQFCAQPLRLRRSILPSISHARPSYIHRRAMQGVINKHTCGHHCCIQWRTNRQTLPHPVIFKALAQGGAGMSHLGTDGVDVQVLAAGGGDCRAAGSA